MQTERTIYFVLSCTFGVVSCLQLLQTVRAMPVPLPQNETVLENKTVVNETNCNCNGTNLTMMMDGQFLRKWLEYNSHHSVRHLSESARNLAANTDGFQVRAGAIYSNILLHNIHISHSFILSIIFLQTQSCYYEYSNNFNLTYHRSQPVTHALLRQFYNGFILHRRFIQEKFLILWINKHLRKQLNAINRELNWNIARLHHVVSMHACINLKPTA